MATWFLSGWSSSEAKVRPSAGFIPRISKISGRNDGGFDPFGQLADGQRRRLKAHGRHLIQRLVLGPKLPVVRRAKAAIAQLSLDALFSHSKDQTVRVFVRQGTKQEPHW